MRKEVPGYVNGWEDCLIMAANIARSLASDHSENEEYDRALVELIAELSGMGSQYADMPHLVTELVLGRT